MNRLLLAANKLQILIQGSKFKGVRVVRFPDGREQEVVTFSHGKLFYYYGETTVVNTIMFHESAFQSEKTVQYLMAHEGTHQKEMHAFLIPLAFVPPLGLWFALSWAGLPVGLFVDYAVLWFIEFRAECQTIRALGIQAVLEGRRDARAILKPSTLARTVHDWVGHPPESLVIRVCRLLHKDVH